VSGLLQTSLRQGSERRRKFWARFFHESGQFHEIRFGGSDFTHDSSHSVFETFRIAYPRFTNHYSRAVEQVLYALTLIIRVLEILAPDEFLILEI
jgi:hypothetical protein